MRYIWHKSMLKERSGRTLMRGGGGETCSTYQSGDLIMEGVRRAGHRFEMDKRTPGDGNCFPRAAKQQCDRQAVEINSIQSHTDLRRKVTNYMLQSEDKVVVNMRRRWEELEVRWPWKSYWRRMARDTEWVEEPFIWATAWLLNRDIWIVWDTASPENLLTFFSGDREGNGTVCPGVPLIIGHHTDTHYQSLLPEGDPLSNSLDIKRLAVGVDESLEKVRESHERKSRPKRKDPPARSESGDVGDSEVTVFNYGQKPVVEAKKMPGGKVQYSCLLCKSQQKQIASHVKKKHADMFQNEELEEFQVSLKTFANAAWCNKWVSKEKKRDPEGFKKAKRESKSRSRGKRTAEVLDVDKQKDKSRKKARRSNNPEKFQEEMRYGHIFPCASCHTMKHRDQVVELNQQQEDKIDGKARENHQTLQVINISCKILI